MNGQAGTLAALHDGRVHIELDNGRRVALPDSYAHDGHLDHAYATTAHGAQGATVDRAFVLGSAELYREWGYTALARHRDEARFYITASQDFLNQAPSRCATVTSRSTSRRCSLTAAPSTSRWTG